MFLSAAKDEFSTQLEFMRRHSFITKVQLSAKSRTVQTLNDGEVVLHEDFSENFSLKQQSEIMSAHWDQSSVTIFTAVLSSKNEPSKSYAVVCEEYKKDKFLVAACNRAIVNHAAQNGTSFNKVHFFSDGAAGQFKNCYNLSTITNPTAMIHEEVKEADWNFFATSHGKGAVDGVGGTVKRAVFCRILQKKKKKKKSSGQ